ncbi:kinase-like domain-containing protein, partial [Boletus coccyginus]
KLCRELGIWRRLDHPNVVPFLGVAYGFGMHEAMSFVSLWMPHGSLHHFLAKNNRNLGLQHRLRFLLDIANGLHYLHSFPFFHGGLNSNNVLLDADCIARLAGFGYSSLLGNIPEALTYLQRSTARSGALRWIAPEQVDPEESFKLTTKTDIYSLGYPALLISLQVLSGRKPWSEVQMDSIVVLRLMQGHKPGRPESRTLNDTHWHLIQDCWSAIEERPSAEEIIFTIDQFLSHCPQSPPLRDLLPVWSSGANPGVGSSSSLSQAFIEGSSTHIIQAAIEDDQNRYMVMVISACSIMLTPQHLHLPASHHLLV